MDYSPAVSSVQGISQARILEWSGDLPDPEIEPVSHALAGGFFTTEPPGKPGFCWFDCIVYYTFSVPE